MTNLTKIRCFTELSKKLKGYYTEDTESMYYDCSGGDSSETDYYIEQQSGDIGFTQVASCGMPSYEAIERAGSYNCSGG